MSLCLIAIFKNESHILNEFIEHYVKEGVDHFFLIDNGSTDHYSIHYPMVEIIKDPKKHAQIELYNKYYLNKCKKYTWVIVCDLDEMIYARKQFSTIKQCLGRLNPDISQVFIPWKMFGSNGYIKQPLHVAQSFTKREDYDNPNSLATIRVDNKHYTNVKCIAKTDDLIKLNTHVHEMKNKNYICSNGKKNIVHNLYCEISEAILNDSYLHLNHYAIQSLDWFKRVKMTRGDVSTKESDSIRGLNYFYEYDRNGRADEELKNKGLMRSNINGKLG